MEDQSASPTLFDQLMTINREAFAQTHYHTAYYALLAAMHEATTAEDLAGLVRAQIAAEEQSGDLYLTTASPTIKEYGALFGDLAVQIHHSIVVIQQHRLQHGLPPLF